jgi:uncharacterized protein (TIGR03435 family)
MMLQELLTNRFKLLLRRETREVQGYALTLGRDGAKLLSSRDGTAVTWETGYRFARNEKGETVARLNGATASIADLVYGLQEVTGRRVVDRTGITGNFNYRVEYAPFDGGIAAARGIRIADSPYPSLFTAIEEQLGLKLQSEKIPIEVLIIDHVERPSEN